MATQQEKQELQEPQEAQQEQQELRQPHEQPEHKERQEHQDQQDQTEQQSSESHKSSESSENSKSSKCSEGHKSSESSKSHESHKSSESSKSSESHNSSESSKSHESHNSSESSKSRESHKSGESSKSRESHNKVDNKETEIKDKVEYQAEVMIVVNYYKTLIHFALFHHHVLLSTYIMVFILPYVFFLFSTGPDKSGPMMIISCVVLLIRVFLYTAGNLSKLSTQIELLPSSNWSVFDPSLTFGRISDDQCPCYKCRFGIVFFYGIPGLVFAVVGLALKVASVRLGIRDFNFFWAYGYALICAGVTMKFGEKFRERGFVLRPKELSPSIEI